jgi:hypothetical protein
MDCAAHRPRGSYSRERAVQREAAAGARARSIPEASALRSGKSSAIAACLSYYGRHEHEIVTAGPGNSQLVCPQRKILQRKIHCGTSHRSSSTDRYGAPSPCALACKTGTSSKHEPAPRHSRAARACGLASRPDWRPDSPEWRPVSLGRMATGFRRSVRELTPLTSDGVRRPPRCPRRRPRP